MPVSILFLFCCFFFFLSFVFSRGKCQNFVAFISPRKRLLSKHGVKLLFFKCKGRDQRKAHTHTHTHTHTQKQMAIIRSIREVCDSLTDNKRDVSSFKRSRPALLNRPITCRIGAGLDFASVRVSICNYVWFWHSAFGLVRNVPSTIWINFPVTWEDRICVFLTSVIILQVLVRISSEEITVSNNHSLHTWDRNCSDSMWRFI